MTIPRTFVIGLVALLTCAALASAQISVPASSIVRPEDLGVRAHTNIIVNVHPFATQPGSSWETPSSIACVYQIVQPVVGCPISGTTLNPTGGSGAIAIVDAYDYPTAAGDLTTFSNQFRLPAANFTVVYATGTKPAQDPTGDWEMEEALDIEWAHAMAPNAKLYLVEAASSSFTDLFTAEQVASNLVIAAGGGEVSNSWGGSEFSGENSDDSYFTGSTVAFFASTGDCAFCIEYPSVSPNVTAAGGTTLQRNASGNFTGEIYWDDGYGGGGGGLSADEGIPSFQNGISVLVGIHRGVPDISSDADPVSGVAIYDSIAYEGVVYDWMQIGGTSVASPTLAGRANAAGSSRSSVLLANVYSEYANPIFKTADFRDITQTNSNCKAGWDICAGVGSPLGFNWVNNRLTRAKFDFDGDGKTDIAVFRKSTGQWFIIDSHNGNQAGFVWGNLNDIPVPGDYDGDGKTDLAYWHPADGTWHVQLSSTGASLTQQWGSQSNGDIPMPGDYDGDGKTDYAVFRASTGQWFVIGSKTGGTISTTWGSTGDHPVAGDFDGDGKTDFAYWHPADGTWHVQLSSTGGTVTQQWGSQSDGDIPVSSDYDGDGKTDYAVFRASTGQWFVLGSRTGAVISTVWGNSTDQPVTGDFDGDGKTDFAYWNPSNGTWYIQYSSTGATITQSWGAQSDGDIPVPATYIH